MKNAKVSSKHINRFTKVYVGAYISKNNGKLLLPFENAKHRV